VRDTILLLRLKRWDEGESGAVAHALQNLSAIRRPLRARRFLECGTQFRFLPETAVAMRKAAIELDLATEDITQGMMERTGQPESVVRSWFNPTEDKYFTAEQAVAVGLADGFFELPSVPIGIE